jgi:presequence protease
LLYEGTIYANNSGGIPEHITDLSYQELLDFYKKFYSVSNLTIFSYGDLNFRESLEFFDKNYLSSREKLGLENIGKV